MNMQMLWARIAMGDDALLMREMRWRQKLGWLTTTDTLQRMAEPHARKLIWC